MTIFTSIIKKETLHLLRDFRTMTIVLIMPLVLLLLFGFAISTEVNDVRVVAVAHQHTDATRLLAERLRANADFTFCGMVTPDAVEPMLRRGEADAAVVIDCRDGRLRHQIIVDASNTNMAQTAAAYLSSVVSSVVSSGIGSGTGSVVSNGASAPVIINTLYNPQLKSAYNFVPGIMGMIFILICAMMTSVSIVSEKETGTMDLMLVSPVRPHVIILGKIVPYFVLSCIILSLMLLLSYTVLGLPFSANVVSVVSVTILYIVLALGFGLLVSTVVSTQVTALIVSGVLLMIPVLMLSGMIFPVDNMPAVLQWLSCIIPARWYISAMRSLMIQQLPLTAIATEVGVLAGMTVAVLALAIGNFRTKY